MIAHEHWQAALIVAFGLAMSSDAVAFSNLEHHAENASPRGQVVMAVTIYQSFMAIPVLAAIPPELAEAELFGHTRGAFTGAQQARPGFFAQADGGTLGETQQRLRWNHDASGLPMEVVAQVDRRSGSPLKTLLTEMVNLRRSRSR